MTNQQAGEELNQLSRLLFDAAANKWYLAIGLEIVSGLVAVVVGVAHFPDDVALYVTLVGIIPLVIAYVLRLQFSDQYGVAETMRRQSILCEALDWPVDKIQMSEWKQRAGVKLRKVLKLQPRDPDYYATRQPMGLGRLAEMTIESTFYTRHFYLRLKGWVWMIFVAATALLILVLVVALTNAVPKTLDMIVAQALVLLLPIVLAVDLLGWGLKLQGLTNGIREVEADLERIRKSESVDLPQVMRLVSEYNCQVVTGLPIHNLMFARWHNEIAELWQERSR